MPIPPKTPPPPPPQPLPTVGPGDDLAPGAVALRVEAIEFGATDPGSVTVRRLVAGDPYIADVQNGYALRPNDLLVVGGNARCLIVLYRESQNTEDFAHIQSILVKPSPPRWLNEGEKGPSPADYRVVSFRSPPALEVRNHTVESSTIYEVWCESGFAQILG